MGNGPRKVQSGGSVCSVGELGHGRQRFWVSKKVVGQDGLRSCSKQSLAPHRCTCFTSFTGDVAAAEEPQPFLGCVRSSGSWARKLKLYKVGSRARSGPRIHSSYADILVDTRSKLHQLTCLNDRCVCFPRLPGTASLPVSIGHQSELLPQAG